MRELLHWLYGKSARNKHIRDMALKVIEILKQKGSMEYQKLAKELGIGFDRYQKPKRTFYFVVNPLKKIQLIKDKRVFTDKSKKKYNTMYFLSPDTFHGYMNRVLEEFHTKVKD